jgi:hypothetical protein
MFWLGGALLIASPAAQAGATHGVWLDYQEFVAAAHADYEAFILGRGAWRIETGNIVRQGSARRHRVARTRHLRRHKRSR